MATAARGAGEQPRGGVSDQLANERTFLAYMRTALAFIGFGFVIARFGIFVREAQAIGHVNAGGAGYSTPLGIVMVVVGIAVALLGLYRYALVSRALASGTSTPLSERAAGGVVATVAVFGVVLTYVLYRTASP